MARIELEVVSKKAIALGFSLSLLSPGKYRLVFNGTSYGYQGNLDGCIAYLQGWEEHGKLSKLAW